LYRGGECGRSFRNRRKKPHKLRANLIRPDNLTIQHEVLHQRQLRREGLLEVLQRAFLQCDPEIFLLTREPGDPVDRVVVRGSARGRSFCGRVRGWDRGGDVGGGLLRRRDRDGAVGSGLCRRRDRRRDVGGGLARRRDGGNDVGGGLARRRDGGNDVGGVANGSERGRCLPSLLQRVVDLRVRNGLVGTVALGKGLL